MLNTAGQIHKGSTAFRWTIDIAGLAVSVVIGFIGGLFPAIRAARLPIATALRAV